MLKVPKNKLKSLIGKVVRLSILANGGWYTYYQTGVVENFAGDEVKINGDWIKIEKVHKVEMYV